MALPHKATLKDVARAAGVSVSTASRALSSSSLISSETTERVREAASRLEYRPNIQARSLRKAKTNTIGVVIPDITNPFFSLLAAAIEATATRAGYIVVLANYNGELKTLERSLSMLATQRVDGIIVVPHQDAEAMFTHLAKDHIPFVFADRNIPHLHASSVVSNPSKGIEHAVALLVRNGYSHIGYLSGPDDTSSGHERRLAFERECKKNNVTASIYTGAFNEKEGYTGAQELYEKDVQAFLAGDGMLGTGALAAFRDMGVVIGKDIAFISFDDAAAFRLQPYPLTIIDQNVEEMGHIAFSLLYEQMQDAQGWDKREIEQLQIDTALVKRESVPHQSSITARTKSTSGKAD